MLTRLLILKKLGAYAQRKTRMKRTMRATTRLLTPYRCTTDDGAAGTANVIVSSGFVRLEGSTPALSASPASGRVWLPVLLQRLIGATCANRLPRFGRLAAPRR